MLKYDHFPTRFLRTWSEGWNGLFIFTGILQTFKFFLSAICQCQCHYVLVIGKEIKKKANK